VNTFSSVTPPLYPHPPPNAGGGHLGADPPPLNPPYLGVLGGPPPGPLLELDLLALSSVGNIVRKNNAKKLRIAQKMEMGDDQEKAGRSTISPLELM